MAEQSSGNTEIECSFSSSTGSCRGEVICLAECKKDTSGHLRYFKTQSNIDEISLILGRRGIFFDTNPTMSRRLDLVYICQRHRDSYGVYWKRSKSGCSYPKHQGSGKSADRTIGLEVSQEIFCMYQVVVPIGSAICKKCRGQHAAEVNRRTTTQSLQDDTCTGRSDSNNNQELGDGVSIDEIFPSTPRKRKRADNNVSHDTQCKDSQGSAVPSQCSQSSHEEWEPELSDLEKINSAISILSCGSFKPLRSQLLTSLSEVALRTKRHYIQRSTEMVMLLLENIAPQQSNALFVEMSSGTRQHDNIKDGQFQTLVAAYREANTSCMQKHILSLFASDYTKEFLVSSIPGLTKFKIDSARKHSKNGRPQKPNKPSAPMNRLPFNKVQHFIDFISQPQYVQDIAFGQRTLKLSTGQKVQIPDVIRTVIGSRIISSYQAFCDETRYDPVKRSSLYYILKQCSASQRKSMFGLDNTTADGITGMEKLVNLAEQMVEYGTREELSKEIQGRLRTMKQYLSCDYRWHISTSSCVADHCITYALSDPKSGKFSDSCDHSHNDGCDFCSDFVVALDEMEDVIESGQFPSNEVKAEILHDFEKSRERALQWKQHILRTVNQEMAKKEILSSLAQDEVLIVLDWAMKFLPWFDREKQSDYYGKKGINWHVSIAIFRDQSASSSYITECHVHLLNSVPQGWFAVASIVEHLLLTIKIQHPTVKIAYLRSDNAACYHCGPLLAAMFGISERTGISVKRYDFSEAQSGKDICDRRTAPLKIHAKQYGHEGHNICTAEELKKALESYGGVHNTQVSVVEVDFSKQELKKCMIPNINHLNNFCFTDGGLRMWKAYRIGEGQLISRTEVDRLSNSTQGQTGLVVIEGPIRRINRYHGRTTNVQPVQDDSPAHRQPQEIVDCPVLLDQETASFICGICDVSFHSLKDYDLHQDIGNHNITTEDKAKLLWTGKCLDIKDTVSSTTLSHSNEQDSTRSTVEQGWALKKSRQNRRFCGKVKDFVHSLFEEGEKTGRKYTPNEAAKRIRNARDVDGNRIFPPEDWLSVQQIQGLFSRFAHQPRDKSNENFVDIDLQEVLQDIEQMENENREIQMIESLCSGV